MGIPPAGQSTSPSTPSKETVQPIHTTTSQVAINALKAPSSQDIFQFFKKQFEKISSPITRLTSSVAKKILSSASTTAKSIKDGIDSLISTLRNKIYPDDTDESEEGIELTDFANFSANPPTKPFTFTKTREQFEDSEEWVGSSGSTYGEEKIKILQTKETAKAINEKEMKRLGDELDTLLQQMLSSIKTPTSEGTLDAFKGVFKEIPSEAIKRKIYQDILRLTNPEETTTLNPSEKIEVILKKITAQTKVPKEIQPLLHLLRLTEAFTAMRQTPSKETEAAFETALEKFDPQTDDQKKIKTLLYQYNCCKKAQISLDREQGELHATGTREAMKAITTAKHPGVTVDDVVIVEPPNVQKHSHGDDRFLQSGALSDHRNTLLSLPMLRAVARRHAPDKTPIEQSLIERFDAKKKEITELKRRVDSGESTLTTAQKAMLDHILSDFKHPDKALIEREFILKRQALILIREHVQDAIDTGWTPGTPLTISHQSLLNPVIDTWNTSSGVTHSESTMIEDMADIFKKKSVSLIFTDTETASMGDDGTIILPKAMLKKQPTTEIPTTLTTHFANTRITRSGTKGLDLSDLNEPMLRALENDLFIKIVENNKALETEPPSEELLIKKHLLDKALKSLQAAKKALEKKEASPQVAIDLIEAQVLAGWRVSFGCYSNKDRGGLVGKRVLIQMQQHRNEAWIAYLQDKLTKDKTTDKTTIEQKIEQLKKANRELNPLNWSVFNLRSLQKKIIDHTVTKRQLIIKVNPFSDLRIFIPENLKVVFLLPKKKKKEESARSESN